MTNIKSDLISLPILFESLEEHSNDLSRACASLGVSEDDALAALRESGYPNLIEIELPIYYHPDQYHIFYEVDARYKIVAKGRRFGFTRGLAQYAIEQMLENVTPVLWVDTVYNNIERYYDRYFLPVLRAIPRNLWQWRSSRHELRILDSTLDLRSADSPENIEGFGYQLVLLNEAGIILRNRKLWQESIRPMMLDYKADVIIGGTPKGKRNRRKDEQHLFFELHKKGEAEHLHLGQLADALPVSDEQVEHAQHTFETEPDDEPDEVPTTMPARGDRRKWYSFSFSSYSNSLLDPEEIAELEAETPQALRRQEIGAHFVEENEEEIIRREWWQYFDLRTFNWSEVEFIVQSWDTAHKKGQENDFSAGTTWARTHTGFYLIDCINKRLTYPALKKTVIRWYNERNPDYVLVEDAASGISLIQSISEETSIPIRGIPPDGDKVLRANRITPLFESSRVFIAADQSWTETVINQCSDFPLGEHDDIVDSCTQALSYLKGLLISPSTPTKVRVDRHKKYSGYQ